MKLNFILKNKWLDQFGFNEDKKTQSFAHEDLEKDLYLRITEFGVKHPDGFTHDNIIGNRKLGLKVKEKGIVEKYLHSAHINARETKTLGRSGNSETPFLLVGNPSGHMYSDDTNKYTLSFDAHFKYIDYLELKFAREHATEAKILSTRAIKIASITLAATVIGLAGGFFFQYKSIQTSNKNLQIATIPVVNVEATLANDQLQLMLANRSLSDLDDIQIEIDVLGFPRKVDSNFSICDLFTLEHDNTSLRKGETFSKTYDVTGLAARVDKIQEEAYKEPINGVIRILLSYERRVDHQNFTEGELFLILDKNSLIELQDVMALAVHTEDSSEGMLGIEPFPSRLIEYLLKYNGDIYNSEKDCPVYQVNDGTYMMGFIKSNQ